MVTSLVFPHSAGITSTRPRVCEQHKERNKTVTFSQERQTACADRIHCDKRSGAMCCGGQSHSTVGGESPEGCLHKAESHTSV